MGWVPQIAEPGAVSHRRSGARVSEPVIQEYGARTEGVPIPLQPRRGVARRFFELDGGGGNSRLQRRVTRSLAQGRSSVFEWQHRQGLDTDGFGLFPLDGRCNDESRLGGAPRRTLGSD